PNSQTASASTSTSAYFGTVSGAAGNDYSAPSTVTVFNEPNAADQEHSKNASNLRLYGSYVPKPNGRSDASGSSKLSDGLPARAKQQESLVEQNKRGEVALNFSANGGAPANPRARPQAPSVQIVLPA